LVEVAIPEAELAEPAFFSIMMIDTSAYHRRFLRDHADQYGHGTRVAIEVGELIPGTHYVIGQRARVLLRRGFREVFDREALDAFLVPGWGPAPLAQETPANLLNFSLRLSAGNLTGLPAMSVPCGFTAEGLPLSFELYGRPFEDATILRVARAYEEAHPWFRQ